jgi:uncharacterized protein YecT (DUF1311 family)
MRTGFAPLRVRSRASLGLPAGAAALRAGIALTGMLTMALSVAAQPADPCATQANTIEINQCLSATHAARDKALNAAYQDLLKRLAPADRFDTTDYPRARKHLIDSQRAWITFRDNDCKGRLVLYETGTIRGAVYAGCLIEHTEQRTRALQAWTGAPGSRPTTEPK